MAREKREKIAKADRTKPTTQAQGSSWTQGRALGGRVVSILLIAGIACGPVALFAAASRPPAVIAAATDTGVDGLTSSQQEAGAYGLGFVASWLTATKEAPGDLGSYIDVAALRSISEESWQYRDLGLVSITPVEDSIFVSVVVAANVKELSYSDTGEGTTEAWPRRYFQVAVSVDETSAFRVVGLPAPIAPPAQGATTSLVYAQTIGSSDPTSQTVTAFLGAYLAGSGDLARVSAPGSEFTALDPAPYAMVEILELRSDVMPSKTPADGDAIRVLATVSLLSPLEQQLTSTYTLTLTARASRWEVSAIDLAPQAIPGKGSDTPRPSPTGDGSTKGN